MFASLFLLFFLARDALDDPFDKEVRDIVRGVADAILDWRLSLEASRDECSPLALED